MDLQGKIIAALEQRSGTSSNGEPWVSQDFVMETCEQYPKHMVFNVFGQERLTRFALAIGQLVLVRFNIDAHPYQGRWYNSIRASDVLQIGTSATSASAAATATPAQPQAAAPAQTQAPADAAASDAVPF